MYSLFYWCCSATKSCLTLWNPVDCSIPGLSVHHQLPELSQTHVHWVGDAILCHPLLLPPSIFPSNRVFQMSQFFTSAGQSIGVTASASVLPMNIQNWFPLGWTGWISLQSKGLSRVFSNTTVQKHQFFGTQLSLSSNSHIHTWLLEKPYLWTRRTFVGKAMSLLLNMLFRLVITFLPRSKRLLISWLQSPSAVILEPRKIKSLIVSIVSPSNCHGSDGTRCHDLSFLNVEF